MAKRYEKEIEEILEQAGEFGSHKPINNCKGIVGILWGYIVQSIGGKSLVLTPGRIMITSVLLLMVGLISNSFIHGVGAWIAWIGFLLFIVGYASFLIRPKRIEKRWRGQLIDDRPESFWKRFTRR